MQGSPHARWGSAGLRIGALGSGAPLLAGGVPHDDPVDLGLSPSARGLAATGIDDVILRDGFESANSAACSLAAP
ncbi:MAG: hypothetical protein U0X73_10290 [Thermoanaerobaculia bacterium]